MTLKEFVNSDAAKLFPDCIKVYFERHDGCHYWTSTFENKINLGNVLRGIKEEVLNQELAMIVPGIGFLRFSFKED